METIMSASLGQLFGSIAAILAALSLVIEFVPVKISPISAILNWIGERTNKGIIKRVDELEKKVDNIASVQSELEAQLNERDAANCRTRILRFSDELRQGVKHSKESFDQALADCDTYERYCHDNPDFKNNRTVVAKSRILSAYKECLGKDNFL